MTQNNSNLEEFAKELSSIVDQPIELKHIHASTSGRFYYIQAPLPNAPMLLIHYRSPFFVDIHPDDLEKIVNGEVSAHDYIHSANWLIGYFWGGGDMISGGYYQPMDIVGRQDDVRRYFKILSCRTNFHSSHYRPDDEKCEKCTVANCPFSQYKTGNWDNEMSEQDPRIDFFNALSRRIKVEIPGYTLSDFTCSDMDDATIALRPNGHYLPDDPFSFSVQASEKLIRELLMRTLTPDNWDEFAKGFKFKLQKGFAKDYIDVSEENIRAAFADVDYATKRKRAETTQDTELLGGENEHFIAKICNMFKNLF